MHVKYTQGNTLRGAVTVRSLRFRLVKKRAIRIVTVRMMLVWSGV